MTDGGNIDNNKKTPGLKNGGNVLFNNPWTFLPSGTTADRPTPSADMYYRLRFNTEDQLYEYYNAILSQWVQLQQSAFTQGPFVTYTADVNLPDAQNLGALADGLLKQTIALGIATLDIAVNGTDYFGPGTIIPPDAGGTGVDNGTSTITIGDDFEMSGAFPFVGTLTGSTSVTFPTSGTLATVSQIPTGAALTRVDDTNVTLTLGGSPTTALINPASLTLGWTGQLGLTRGGTNASLTASNGGIVYSTATGMAILAGTATAGQMLRSGLSSAPGWSTATYPDTAGAAGNSLVSDGTNWISSSSFATVDKISQGRLTLTSGTPVTTANVTGATTLYFTPYKGNQIDLYTGSLWQRFTFTQFSIAVPATTSTLYDVWVYNNAGTPALELLAWSSGTARATALTTQDGVYVKSGDATRRYVGSMYTTGVSGQTADSDSNRFVWNYYNRVWRPMSCNDSTNSWTYSSSTIRQANGSTANQVNYIIGVAEDTVHGLLVVSAQANNLATNAMCGIGINSTTVNSAQTNMGAPQVINTGNVAVTASYNGIPSVGVNYMAWLESNRTNANTVTWYGDNNDPTVIRSGLSMEMWG